MIDHEVNIIEKEDRKSYIACSLVVLEDIECAAFVGEIETRVINSNLQDDTTHNRDISVKDTEEHTSEEEDNKEANVIRNLSERI